MRGQALRDALMLGYLTRHVGVPITAGPNKGQRWSIASSRRFFTGRFEPERVDALLAFVMPSDCFWDVGAHYGYITLAVARRLDPRGKIYAFEPCGRNQWFLRQHLKWNRLPGVEVLPAALSDTDRTERFCARGSGTGSLAGPGGKGTELVKVRSIDSLVRAGECAPPTYLKIDVEGAEADVLRGGRDTLPGSSALILVATHTHALRAECRDLLTGYGYRLEDPERQSSRGGRGRKNNDPDLLAIGPRRSVDDAAVEAFRLAGEN